ncbi:hypothetical protein [Lentzea sp. NPDC051838]|uniref:hypothetical protein n=1 Tax=Lentzea sp. NPDC051838 TaxID=3154849 RepID=UPI0034353D16
MLNDILEAHGGLANWQTVTELTATFTAGGPFWRAKGWPGDQLDLTARLDPRTQRIEFSPFADATLVLDNGEVSLLRDGEVLQARADPRAHFDGLDLKSRWDDPLRFGYFLAYAMWNYLTTPFQFTYPGFTTRELPDWQGMRRLAVSYPDTVHAHHRDQTFYFGHDGLLRRLDYVVDVNGGADVAHLVEDHRTFDGLVFPARRHVHPRNQDNTPDLGFEGITVELRDVEVKRAR